MEHQLSCVLEHRSKTGYLLLKVLTIVVLLKLIKPTVVANQHSPMRPSLNAMIKVSSELTLVAKMCWLTFLSRVSGCA